MAVNAIRARPLVAGAACGPVLKLGRPLSFWGGVDAASGQIVDAQSDGHGCSIAGHVLVLAALRGSSSSSSILLELIHAGKAPAALIVAEADAILIAALLAAREMDWPAPPMFLLGEEEQRHLPDKELRIDADGWLEWE